MSLRGYIKKGKPAAWLSVPGAQPVRAAVRPLRPVKARKAIRRRARRHAARDVEYIRESRAFIAEALADPVRRWCEVAWVIFGQRIMVCDTHHQRGRLGPLLLARQFWQPVSRVGHDWIRDNPEDARKHGWLCQKGDWHRMDDL